MNTVCSESSYSGIVQKEKKLPCSSSVQFSLRHVLGCVYMAPVPNGSKWIRSENQTV